MQSTVSIITPALYKLFFSCSWTKPWLIGLEIINKLDWYFYQRLPEYWGNAVVLGRMYRWMRSSFQGIGWQYLLWGEPPGKGIVAQFCFFFISSFLKSQLCAAPNVHVVQWINIQYSRKYQHVFLFRKSDFLQSRIVTHRFFLGIKLFCFWSESAEKKNL